MIGWPLFTFIFAAFFVTHTVPVRPKVKARLLSYLGPVGFTAAYSALSLFMLDLVIASAGNAPYVQLWPQEIWQYYIVDIGMFVVCLIIAMTLGRPNPFSFGGVHNDRFDPEHPGIIGFTRHPLLTALTLWAGLHLLPNGDLAHVIMFGTFLGFAILGRKIIDLRTQRLMGSSEWHVEINKIRTGYTSFPPDLWFFWARLSAAVILYAALVLLHRPILGVSPLLF
ncbi:MAG: NnrU family protein [Sulfitobacter sp.]